jgi:hypothetical protein
MKKYILLILFILSLTLHFGGNGVTVTTFQNLRAQQQYGCWNENSGSGGGFFSWLRDRLGDVADAVVNVANAISEFLSTGDEEGEGGEEFGNEIGSDDWVEPSGTPDNFFNPLDDPWFMPEGFGQEEWDILNNLDYWYGVYVNGGEPPSQDCNGIWGGSAYVGSCGVCIAGSTGINACFVDSPRIDTAKPIKIPCSPEAIARGNRLTNIRDSINSLSDVQKVKDSAFHSLKEAGVSITNNSGTYGTFNFQSGANNNVNVLTSSTGQNIVVGLHSHNKGSYDSLNAANSPSALDLYHLINGQLLNTNYIADYVFAHDSTEWAIMIDNPTKAANFITTVPMDSATIAPPTDNNWSNTFKLSDGVSLYDKWYTWVVYLTKIQKYPIEDIEGFANVLFTGANLDSGIKFYKKINGHFKELNYQIINDSSGTPVEIKITICE